MQNLSSLRNSWLIAALALAGVVNAQPNPSNGDGNGNGGAVFSMTNDAVFNSVVAYRRASDGKLNPVASYFTGGSGTGGGLGSQGAVTLSQDGKWLFAVDAGSNDIAVFSVRNNGLRSVGRFASGGTTPISVTQFGNLVYVLNAGEANNITGFRLQDNGRLQMISQSSRALSAGQTGPAQVAFSPEGDLLVVTEKATNMIDTFEVFDDGRASARHTFASSGQTPFGFAFGHRSRLFVTEAFGGASMASAVSSYDTDSHGNLKAISASSPTHQTSACWISLDKTGRFAFSSNTGSSSVSGYAVNRHGELSLLQANGFSASTGDGTKPADSIVTNDNKFLYILTSGAKSLRGYRIHSDGSLSPVGGSNSIPTSMVGLAGW